MKTIRYYITGQITSEANLCNLDEIFSINCTGYENRIDNFNNYLPNGRRDNTIMYMQGGEITVIAEDGTSFDLKSGDILFYRQDMFANYKLKKAPVEYYWAHFTGSKAEEILDKFGFENLYHTNIGYDKTVVNLFHKMFDEFTTKYDDYEVISGAYLLQALVFISRLISQIKNPVGTRFRKSVIYIHENFNRDLDVAELAQMEEMSVSRYRELFTKQMGTSPKQYITHQRINNACDLLKSSDFAIDEIAAYCGYSDLRYFYRIFQKNTGITPGQYRKSQLLNS